MKTVLLILLLCLCSTLSFNCRSKIKKTSYARIVRDETFTKVINFPDGSKQLITYEKRALSVIEYFNKSGKWDSIIFYKRGQKYSVTKFSYDQDGGFEKDTYITNRSVQKQIYDNSKNLIYKEPVDVHQISKTRIEFKNKLNTHLSKADTFIIVNNELPPGNRGYQFIGFAPKHMNGNLLNAFVVSPKDIFSSKPFIKIYLHENNERKQLLETIPFKNDK